MTSDNPAEKDTQNTAGEKKAAPSLVLWETLCNTLVGIIEFYFGSSTPKSINFITKLVGSWMGATTYMIMAHLSSFFRVVSPDIVTTYGDKFDISDYFALIRDTFAAVFSIGALFAALAGLALSVVIAKSVLYGSMLRFFLLGFFLSALLSSVIPST